jgi:hypothetical protein
MMPHEALGVKDISEIISAAQDARLRPAKAARILKTGELTRSRLADQLRETRRQMRREAGEDD